VGRVSERRPKIQTFAKRGPLAVAVLVVPGSNFVVLRNLYPAIKTIERFGLMLPTFSTRFASSFLTSGLTSTLLLKSSLSSVGLLSLMKSSTLRFLLDLGWVSGPGRSVLVVWEAVGLTLAALV
jgi:hypothetical protein